MLANDVDAIASICLKRKGMRVETIESCRAIFVTTNYKLAKSCNKFLKYNQYQLHIPPTMGITDITTLLWVKYGFSNPDLPMRQLVAIANAAVTSSKAVMQTFFEITGRLVHRGDISEDEAADMRYSAYARAEIMHISGGNPSKLDDTTVLSVHNRVKESYSKEENIRAKKAEQQLEEANLRTDKALKMVDTYESGIMNSITDLRTTDITNGVYYKEAFYNIKEEVDRKNLILCEDIAAKSLIEGVLTHLNIREFFSVEYRHGGAETLITKHFPILALDEMYDKVFIILDGDKEPEEVIRYSDIPAGEINKLEKLEDYVKKLSASNCRINPLVDGGEKGSNKEQKIEVYQEYLKYAEKHLFYLPGKLVPEAIVLQFDNAKEIYGDSSAVTRCITIYQKYNYYGKSCKASR